MCKIAMDIMAKHIQADEDGVRIAYLDEMLYRNNYGIIGQLQIFGESEEDMQSNLRNMVCIRWEILPDVPWADRMIITMKICCIVFWCECGTFDRSRLGDGNLVPWRRSRPINREAVVLVPVRCYSVHMYLTRHGWWSGR